MATVLRIQDAGGRNGNAVLEQPVSSCCPDRRVRDGGITAGGAKSWGEGSPSGQARLLSKDADLDGYLRCSAWPGQVQMRLWPKPFAGREDTKHTHGGTEQALYHSAEEEWW